MKLRTFPWLLLCIFLFALLIRIAYIAEVSKSPFLLYPGIDANHYQNWAFGLIKGVWPNNRTFVWPPLYPIFLGAAYYLVGNATTAVKIVQAVLGSISCVLTYLIACRLFSSRFVPAAAAIACCLAGPLVFFDAELLSANLDTFLQLAALFSLIVASERESILWWAASGLLVGLSAINRGAALLLIPPVVFWIYALKRWQPGAEGDGAALLNGRRFWNKAAAFVLPVGLLVLPVAWHNAKYVFPEGMPPGAIAPGEDAKPAFKETAVRFLSGRFALLSSEVGLNLFLGNQWAMRELNDPNNPDCFDTYKKIREEPFRKGVRTSYDRNRYFVGKTVDEIAERPLEWMKLLGAKLLDLMNGAEKPRNESIYANRQYSRIFSALLWKKVIAFPSGLIIPLGLLGFVLCISKWRFHFMPIAFWTTQSLFIVIFFVAARYRLSLYPLLAIYGAHAVEQFWERLRFRKWGQAMPIGLAMAGLLIVSNANIGKMQLDHGVFEYNNLGLTLALKKRYGEAIAYLSKALAVNPNDTATNNNIALVLDDMGRQEEAAWHLRASLKTVPDSLETLNNLGNVLVKLGQYGEAELRFRQALEIDPNYVYVLSNFGNLLSRTNRHDQAIVLYRKALAIDPDFAPAHKNLADALYRLGNVDEANRHYFEASRLMNDKAR